jgi:predicted PurR-regulated permease PerM
MSHIQQWITHRFKVPVQEQDRYFDSMVSKNNMLTAGSIGSLTGPILNAILIPIYTFLILIYRALFLRFLIRVTPEEHYGTLMEIVFEIKSVVRSYILGLLLEMAIVSALTAVGFWIVGVEYFIFLGVLTGILNLIPYIGIIVALVISMLVAMVSSPDFTPVIGVLLVNVAVQFVDNNILMPRVVGSKVSINALASMVAVIVGGHLAGVAGMFLALPVVAIVKVIFDRFERTNAIGYLMGDSIPKTFSWRSIRFPDLNAGGNEEEEKDKENREIL